MAKSKRKLKKTKAEDKLEAVSLLRVLGWTLLTGGWLLLAASLLSYDPADPPGHAVAPINETPSNWVGRFGAAVAHHVYLMLGPGVWVGLAGVAGFLYHSAKRRPISQPVLRGVGLLIMSIATSALVGLGAIAHEAGGLMGAAASVLPGIQRPEGAGGLLAVYVNGELVPRFNVVGTLVVVTVGFWVGAILAADTLVLALPRWLARCAMAVGRVRVPGPVLAAPVNKASDLVGWTMSRVTWRRDEDDAKTTRKKSTGRKPRRPGDDASTAEGDDDHIPEDAGGLGGTESFDPDAGRQRRRRGVADLPDEEEDDPVDEADGAEDEYEYEEYEEEDDGEAVDEAEDAADESGGTDIDEDAPGGTDIDVDAGDAPGTYIASKEPLTEDALRDKMKQMTINFAPKAKSAPPAPREMDLSGYRFPGMDLLLEAEDNFGEEQERIVREQAFQLESALQEYKIEGEVVAIDSGPVITLYEVRLAPGTKVSRLNTISSDLARAMKAHNIRVVPNTAGKDTVGIEVPNLKKERVRMSELMRLESEAVQKMRLPMFLGKDASGNPLVEDLSKMPHMLIAGTTGSGKSVCMNSIIMSFLYTRRPDELKMVLVDPKMVEMSLFKDVPHLMCPVVTEMAKAAAILEWAVTKMDERYELLAEAAVRDISSYNALTWDELKERFEPSNEEEEAKIPKKLPYMVFVIDELADLMMTNKEVEGFIVRIAQKARAVGIHLILATQRPQANVVTGLIKSNMPCRVSFKVASGMDSRIVLDQKGAELLLGQGDMLFLSPRSSKLTRAQGTLVDDLEIRRVVKFLKDIAAQSFEPQLIQLKQPGATEEEDAERDPLFDDAVRIVLQTKRGSVSLLQRRLAIGYSRSSRLIEQIAEAGIIGEYKGSQAREVNLTLEEWDAMKAQAEADAQLQAAPAVEEDEQLDDEEAYDDEDGDDAVDEYDEEDDGDGAVDEYDEDGDAEDEAYEDDARA